MSNYTKRYIANIVIEATSPLKVGSNSLDMLQDSPVQKDWNALPMILGTSIAGVLRKEFDATFANDIFGDEDSQKEDAKGSRVIISNALLCNHEMKVIETLGLSKTETFLLKYENLPLRDHVKINHKGVADIENKGKFDDEVVYAGSRFKFRLELMANDDGEFKKLLQQINSKTFRLGAGTTKGFGAIKVVTENSTYDEFTLNSKEYREKSSSLNTSYDKAFPQEKAEVSHTVYMLKIKPDDFFMFGSGFGEDDIKMIPVKEKVVVWDADNKGGFSEEQILIPASSVKGALSHRTAYYYNKAIGATIESGEAKTDENNNAVKVIFGHKKEMAEDKTTELGQKGKILISDCFKEEKKESTKVFDHVSIDRFTGGAIEGALFNEKTIAQRDDWEVEILLENDVKQEFKDAFEKALKDVCTGRLALGGATTKGHGVFSGMLLRDGEVLDV